MLLYLHIWFQLTEDSLDIIISPNPSRCYLNVFSRAKTMLPLHILGPGTKYRNITSATTIFRSAVTFVNLPIVTPARPLSPSLIVNDCQFRLSPRAEWVCAAPVIRTSVREWGELLLLWARISFYTFREVGNVISPQGQCLCSHLLIKRLCCGMLILWY